MLTQFYIKWRYTWKNELKIEPLLHLSSREEYIVSVVWLELCHSKHYGILTRPWWEKHPQANLSIWTNSEHHFFMNYDTNFHNIITPLPPRLPWTNHPRDTTCYRSPTPQCGPSQRSDPRMIIGQQNNTYETQHHIHWDVCSIFNKYDIQPHAPIFLQFFLSLFKRSGHLSTLYTPHIGKSTRISISFLCPLVPHPLPVLVT